MAADQKDMYDQGFACEFPEDTITYETNWTVKPNLSKGGLSLTSYFTYGWLD